MGRPRLEAVTVIHGHVRSSMGLLPNRCGGPRTGM